MTCQLLWALSNVLCHVFRDSGQFNSKGPGLGEAIERGKGRKVEREREERRKKRVRNGVRERELKRDRNRDGDRTKTAVPGELHVVNKCLWNKDLKGERVRDASGLRGGSPAP